MCGAMPGSTKAGELLNAAHLPKYLCPSCKAEIIGEHRYCPACMKELSEAAKKADVQEQGSNDCIQCGVSLPVGAKFCHECGAKQESHCTHCGAIIMPNAKFCNNCGAKQNSLQNTKPTKDNATNVSGGNAVSIQVSSLEIAVATYKVEDKTVIFDLSGVFDVCNNMTVDNLIEMGKKVLPIVIKELESAIGKEKNAEIKAEMEKTLKIMKENLEELKKATQELKEELKSVVEQIKKQAKELEIYKQIKGILNTDNSELAFDIPGVGKVILKKQK